MANGPESTAPAAAAPTPSRRDPIYRDSIEAFVAAIALALVVKHFAVEAYKVPTGSMEPTILGDEMSGDRIVVNKIAALVREPRRWEIWVFQYPNDQRINYIKRVAGVGPERLFIIDGDLYSAPFGNASRQPGPLWGEGLLAVQRKPDTVQRALFDQYPQVAADDLDHPDQESFQRYWYLEKPPLAGDVAWSFEGDHPHLRARTLIEATFRQQVRDQMDRFADLGAENPFGEFLVGDVKIGARVRPTASGGALRFTIEDPQSGLILRARVPIAGDVAEARIDIRDGETFVVTDLAPLAVNEWVDVAFANVDDEVQLWIDDAIVARRRYDHQPNSAARAFGRRQRLAFGLEGGEADFDRCGVWRDLYFREGDLSAFDIPAQHYCFLGDNSAASKDSREWVRITLTTEDGVELTGDAEAVRDPDQLDSRLDNPWRADQLAGGAGDDRVYFLDQHGCEHLVGRGRRPWTSFSREHAPLVPRRFLMGRAFGVFLPVQRLGIVR